jgi:preprotein translocase subunit SecG
MSFIFYFVLILFLLLCALLTFVILIQESKSTGFGATFGGDSSDSLFGTSTSDVLKKFTGYLVVIFMISCIVLSLWTSALGRAKEAALAPTIEEAQK